MELIFLLVSFLASVIGSICGVGGGVVIKPVLDAFGVYSVSAISFVSGCIVLAMSGYSMLRVKLSRTSLERKDIGSLLGSGAALGGIAGKYAFETVKNLAGNNDAVGAVQAVLLFVITLATLIYTLKKSSIHSLKISGCLPCIGIGLLLGLVSSFLGIGGGPMNLIVLCYFFSMETKEAAENSLYIILISQAASFVSTVLFGNIPTFPVALMLLMMACGVLGGIVGRSINRRISSKMVDTLFSVLLVVIMMVCIYNHARFVS